MSKYPRTIYQYTHPFSLLVLKEQVLYLFFAYNCMIFEYGNSIPGNDATSLITMITMNRVAIFPGSFDPITVGHESVVLRSLSMFDKVIVAVGYNASKKAFFSIDKRVEMIEKVFANEPKVEVISYEGLTVDLCNRLKVNYILRGLRTSADFEFERAIAQVNKAMFPQIETVFLLTAPEHTPVNSTIIRDILLHKGDPSQFIPTSLRITDYL